MGVTWNDKAMVGRIKGIKAGFRGYLAQAVRGELEEVEMPESMARTPVDPSTAAYGGHRSGHGELRDSHRVVVNIEGNLVVGKITVGSVNDPVVDYATYVHEDMEAHHTTGQAKFLESTLFESRPFIGGRIAQRAQLAEMRT